MKNSTIIKLNHENWKKEHSRFNSLLDTDAYLCYVPNSIPSHPYNPHPQFSFKIGEHRITVFTDANKIKKGD